MDPLRRLLNAVIAFACITPALAQLPPHQFSLRLGYSSLVEVTDIVVDNDGNIFAVGNFNNSIDLDPGPNEDVHVTQGGYDFFLAAFDADGAYLWGRVYGSENNDYCNAIAFDPLDNTIVLGGYAFNDIDFDGIEVTLGWVGAPDVFLYKLSTSGTPIWANAAASGTDTRETLNDIALDDVGDIYYTGLYRDSQSSPSQITVVKCTASGLVQAEYFYGGTNEDFGTHLLYGPGGDLHVLGVFNYRSTSPYDITFGSFTFNSGSTFDYGDNIVYLKLSAASGTVLNARVTAHRADNERPSNIAIDPDGSVYIAGRYGQSQFPTHQVFGMAVPAVTSSNLNGFVAKLHPAGMSGSWVRSFSVPNSFSSVDALGVDDAGLVYTCGSGQLGMDIDPTSGSVLPLPSGSSSYLTRFNNDGSFHDGYFLDQVTTLKLLVPSDGSVILGGSYSVGADLDPGPDVVTLPSASAFGSDGFVSKLFDISTTVMEAATNDLRLAPNPANTLLTITGALPNMRYTVLDLPGHAVRRGRFNGASHSIDVSSLAPGTYVLQVEGTEGTVESRRFVVSAR